MITVVGVAHVIDLKRQIENIIVSKNPDVVAVELDYGRYYAMTHKIEGKMPYIYRKMSEMQKSLAEMLGTEVGREMLTAVQVARALGKDVAFIDMDAAEIAKRIRKNMSVWEKIKLYFSIFLAPFSKKKVSEKDVKDIIEHEDVYISYLKKRFPGLSKALFDDRERVMADNLIKLSSDKNVVAFVGDGHINGLKKRIKDAEFIHLKEIMGDSMSTSYTVSLN